ncbi:MAG TPA: hypothetical protein VEW48_12700 [Thermoanaerobaculia bacterium]|nr:hypothetical protein [Thermoanaerobaculia bacterium]
MLSDQLWEQWVMLQKQSFHFAAKKDYSRAIEGLNRFLQEQDSPELRREILGLRGELMERQGRIREAKEDYLAAHALSTPATYGRYVLELMLASLHRKVQDSAGARSWFLKALETVVEDSLTSGATAIAGLVEQRGIAELTPRERILCEKALQQAWRLFSLPGEPELGNLHSALKALDDASMRPLPSTGVHEPLSSPKGHE